MARAKGARPRLGYRATLDWLLDNDDTDWLDDENPIPSVTASLTADIFGHEVDRVTADLQRRLKTRERGSKR